MNATINGPSFFCKGLAPIHQLALLKKQIKHNKKTNHGLGKMHKDDYLISINDFIRPLEINNRIFIYRDIHNHALKCKSFIQFVTPVRYKKSFLVQCIKDNIFTLRWDYKCAMLNLTTTI